MDADACPIREARPEMTLELLERGASLLPQAGRYRTSSDLTINVQISLDLWTPRCRDRRCDQR